MYGPLKVARRMIRQQMHLREIQIPPTYERIFIKRDGRLSVVSGGLHLFGRGCSTTLPESEHRGTSCRLTSNIV
jgi:hypothetical protein